MGIRRLFKSKWWETISITLILLFVLLNILAFFHAKAMSHFSQTGIATQKPEHLTIKQKLKILFTGINLPRPQGKTTPASAGLVYENHQVESSAGILLGAWYIPNNHSKALIILFHGYAEEKSIMMAEAKLLYQLGYSIFMVDFRGCGTSSGSTTSIGYWEAEDVKVAMKYAKERFKPMGIILLGYSMGAVAILRAIDIYRIDPEVIILEALFDKFLNTTTNRFREMGLPVFPSAHLILFWGGIQMGFNAFNHNPITYARSINCPVLFLQGAQDNRATPQEAQRIYQVIQRQQKVFKIFQGISHEHSAHRLPKKWQKEVECFLIGSTGK